MKDKNEFKYVNILVFNFFFYRFVMIMEDSLVIYVKYGVKLCLDVRFRFFIDRM